MFVSAVFHKIVVGNLVLFLTVSIVVVFVALLLWGFLSGGEAKIGGVFKIVAGVVVVVAVIFALLWAGGWDISVINFFFDQSWSKAFWTNVAFLAVIAVALAAILKGTS